MRKADGTIIRLSEQPLSILVALLDRPGALVLREANYPEKCDEQAFGVRETVPMKKPSQHLIAEVPRRQRKVEMTIGIDLGDVWSRYRTLHQGGDIVGRGRFRTNV